MTAIDWGKVNDMPQDEAVAYVVKTVRASDQASGETKALMFHPQMTAFIKENKRAILDLIL